MKINMDMFDRPPRKEGFIWKYVISLVLLLIGLLMLYFCWQSCQHYWYVRENAVEVIAEGWKVEDYSDSESDCYYVFVKYTYQGQEYTGKYTNYSSKTKAEALMGQPITIYINPEKPTEQVKDAKDDVGRSLLIAALLLGFSVHCLGKPDREWYVVHYGWRRETAAMDLRRKSCHDVVSWGQWLGPGGIFIGMRLIFGDAVDTSGVVVGAVCLLIGFVMLFLWIKNLKSIRSDDYRLTTITLVKKEEDSDSDSTTYWLYYTDGEKEIKLPARGKKYYRAVIGETSQCAFLGNAQRPYLQYDRHGVS